MNNIVNVKESSKSHFDDIAKDYNNSHDGKYINCMYHEIIERIVSMEDKPTKILDLGCGNGNVISLLSDKIDAQLFGVDLSENMVLEAKSYLQEKAEFQVGDAEQIPYKDKMFDVVICNASFHHYPNPLIVLDEIKRVLNDDGIFILGDPTAPFGWILRLFNWTLRYSDSGDYHIYGKKEIIPMLEQEGFKVMEWKNINMKSFILTAKINQSAKY